MQKWIGTTAYPDCGLALTRRHLMHMQFVELHVSCLSAPVDVKLVSVFVNCKSKWLDTLTLCWNTNVQRSVLLFHIYCRSSASRVSHNWFFDLIYFFGQVVSGGVGSNLFIRSALTRVAQHYGMRLLAPPPALCTDNGVMIAWWVLFEQVVYTQCNQSTHVNARCIQNAMARPSAANLMLSCFIFFLVISN